MHDEENNHDPYDNPNNDNADMVQDVGGFLLPADPVRAALHGCRPIRIPRRGGLLSESFFFGHHVLYLESGKGDIWLVNPDGQEMLVDFLRPGEFLGETFPITGQTYPNIQVVARYPCVIRQIPSHHFLTLINHSADFASAIMRQLALRQGQLLHSMASTQFVPVSERVYQVLESLCNDEDSITHPEGVMVHITRQDLARMVGCSRESAGRAVQTLTDRGLMEARGKTMLVYGMRKAPDIAFFEGMD